MVAFIDRCRMYIRRSGGNPHENFAVEMLKTKVFENLSPAHKTILEATLGQNDDLEKIISTADKMIGAQAGMIGAVVESESTMDNHMRAQGNFREGRLSGAVEPGTANNFQSHIQENCRETSLYNYPQAVNNGLNTMEYQEGNRLGPFGYRQPVRDVPQQFNDDINRGPGAISRSQENQTQ